MFPKQTKRLVHLPKPQLNQIMRVNEDVLIFETIKRTQTHSSIQLDGTAQQRANVPQMCSHQSRYRTRACASIKVFRLLRPPNAPRYATLSNRAAPLLKKRVKTLSKTNGGISTKQLSD